MDNIQAWIKGRQIMSASERADFIANHHQIISTQTLPPNAKRFFSGKNLEKFDALISNPLIFDLDQLTAFGELSNDELQEYFVNLPEYQQLRIQSREVIQSFFEFIVKSMPSIVKKCVPKPNGMFNFYPLIEVFKEISLLCFSKMQGLGDEVFRNVTTGSFETRLVSELIVEFYEQLQKQPFPQPVKEAFISQILSNVNTYFLHSFGSKVPAEHYIRHKPTITESRYRHQQGYNDLISGFNGLSEIDLKKSADQKFQSILDLEPLIKTAYLAKKKGKSSIEVRGLSDLLDPLSNAFSLYQVRIALDPSYQELFQIPTHVTNTGSITTMFEITNQYFECLVERPTGVLSITSGLSYSKIFGELDYQKIRNVVFDLILEGLLQSEYRHKEEPSNKQLIGAEINQTHDELVQVVPLQPLLEENPTTIVQQPAFEEVLAEQINLRKLRGLKGKQVLSILKSLLNLVRVSGSHHIFECKGSGTYPISIHPGKDVGTGLLLNCLKKFGVLEEFLDRL